MTAYTRAASSGPSASSDAARWLDEACAGRPVPPLLIVVGLAEGYLLDVLEARAPETRVLAIEPDKRMADAFAARRDWSQWRSSGRLAHLVHPDYTGADEAWRMFPRDTNACLLMVNPGLEGQHPSTGNAARVAQKILYGVRANAEARRQFAPRYLTNVIRNTPAIARGQDVRLLTDAFRGVPAVIAAAGPSLDAAVRRRTAGFADRALLIAADTALRPLLARGRRRRSWSVGARPEHAQCPSLSGAAGSRHLAGRRVRARSQCDGPLRWTHVLAACLEASSVALAEHVRHRRWPGRRLGFGADRCDAGGDPRLEGSDPIVLVGADLAFTGGLLRHSARNHLRIRLGLEPLGRQKSRSGVAASHRLDQAARGDLLS